MNVPVPHSIKLRNIREKMLEGRKACLCSSWQSKKVKNKWEVENLNSEVIKVELMQQFLAKGTHPAHPWDCSEHTSPGPGPRDTDKKPGMGPVRASRQF